MVVEGSPLCIFRTQKLQTSLLWFICYKDALEGELHIFQLETLVIPIKEEEKEVGE